MTLEPTRLQQLLEKHRLWVADDPNGKRLELRDVSLVGAVLSKAIFSRALLTDVDFSGAELSYAGFSGAQLERVTFCEAMLKGASFMEARLTECAFDRARFAEAQDPSSSTVEDVESGADFQRAKLNNVSFCDSVLRTAEFTDAHLEVVIFDRSDLRRADFVASQVTNSSFVGAQLCQSILAKASFRNVTLRGADLSHARLRRLMGRGAVDLSRSDLSGADLVQADFEVLDVRNANLADSTFSKTRIRTAYVHGTWGLPFLFELSNTPDLDFSAHADAADSGNVLRLAQQLGDTSGLARFGGVTAAHYRCRVQEERGNQQYVIESTRPGSNKAEAIRVVRVYPTEDDGLRTLKVEYRLFDKRFCDWDELAHVLIFELVLLGQLRDQYRKSTDAILYLNLDGGMRMTDYDSYTAES